MSILFGWPDDRDDAEIETVADGDSTKWMLGDEELTRWTPSDEPLDDAQRTAFDRFLQRHCHLHWEIREEIAADARAPASMHYRWHNTGMRATAEWTLASCTRSADRPKGIDGLTREFPDNAVGRLARCVLAPDDATPKRLSHDDLVELSNAARDAGRPEDAALLLLESSLQDASDVTSALRALLGREDSATRIRAIMGSVTRANTEPEQGIAELDAVDRTTLTHPAILDVFRANGLANLQRTADAVVAFESALTELPWLSAAYNDLGMALHRAFRTDEAWLAWEAGRAVGAEHPTWRGVQGLEEHLRDVYGELL